MSQAVAEPRREPHRSAARELEDEGEHPAANVSSYRAGEAIYRQGDPAAALFILASGRVRLYRRSKGSAVLLTEILRAGAPFGLDCLTADDYSESAQAETKCIVRAVPGELVDRLIARQPGFATGLLEALVRRRTAAERMLARALITGVPGRLAGALLDAAQDNVVDGLTRQQLAEAAWTTRETGTRVLFQFAADGLVRVEGRRIALQDPVRLRRLAAGAHASTAA
jgi:CRP/FNR family transcriptional regulator